MSLLVFLNAVGNFFFITLPIVSLNTTTPQTNTVFIESENSNLYEFKNGEHAGTQEETQHSTDVSQNVAKGVCNNLAKERVLTCYFQMRRT